MGAPLDDPALALDGQRASLSAYLRLLWNVAPPLLRSAPPEAGGDVPPLPFLTTLGLHLPPAPAFMPPPHAHGEAARWYRASAAHAAAHIVYSRLVFDRAALAPITQALIGVLEDARVEALACRELPGLRRLWASFHRATPQDGDGFEPLLLRLARRLVDPSYDDPHPWVRKGHAMLFLDAGGEVLALRQPDELCRAASALGHDIGQMRLGFNARSYVAGPSYRDDNRWMWRADPSPASAADPLPSPAMPSDAPPDLAPPRIVRHYPEWDRLIGRLRTDWCSVAEQRADGPGASRSAAQPGLPTVSSSSADRPMPSSTAGNEDARIAGHLEAVMWLARSRRRHLRDRETEGEELDLEAAIEASVARRIGVPADERLHRRVVREAEQADVLLLLDVSASTAEPHAIGGPARLAVLQRAAALLVEAMQGTGYRSAVQAFCSDGRRGVQVLRVKTFDEDWDEAAQRRLAGLRSGLSTRLGAALRHATHSMLRRHGAWRSIVVITDGEPHDIDVHDPRYLLQDARVAVSAAAREGIDTYCIGLDAAGEAASRAIFGAGHWATLHAVERLPSLVGRLLL